MHLPVIQLPVFLSHVWSQSYSSLFSPCVLVVLVYNTLSWLLPATVLHKDVDTWSSHPKITYPYSSSGSCSWTTHRDSRCWQPSLLQSRWYAILCKDFKGRWNRVVCWGAERKKKIICFAKSQIRHASLVRGRCLTKFSPFSLSWNIPLRTRNVTCFWKCALQVGQPCASICPQDPCQHWTVTHWWRLLHLSWRLWNHLESFEH